MSLNNFKSEVVHWDKANSRIYKKLSASSSDQQGRKLVVKVLDNNQEVDLSRAKMYLAWKTKDEKHKGYDAFTAVDVKKGIFEVYYTVGMLSNIGTLDAHIDLSEKGKQLISSLPFPIEVFKGTDAESIEASDSFTALTKALARVSSIESSEQQRKTNEQSRVEYEKNRKKAETSREQGEKQRESQYKKAETERDNQYDTAEDNRNGLYRTAESKRDTKYEDAEKTRQRNYKGQFDSINDRVDNIITTPADTINVQEIIDARYSGVEQHTYKSLGQRLDTMEQGGKILDYTNAPGPKALVAGDRKNGFYGFVQAQDMGRLTDNLSENQEFNGKNLALAIGLSSGTSQHENTSWMKFSRNGEIYFVPVKPIRHTLSWNSIYKQGAVYGDNTMGVNPPNGRAGHTISVSETDNSFRIDEIEDHWQRDGAVIATVGDTIVAKGFTEDENNGEFEVTAITDYKITVNKTLVAEERSKGVSVYNKKDAVKQDCEVTIGDNKYKVQLLKGAGDDPLDSYSDSDRGLVGP
ncbi:MAG: BppU family phage baseplate upper protein, partial [Tetragenococcus halophilus]|nr:BppU family phage baseplate upper protein [Tetragenococcus halophilus]